MAVRNFWVDASIDGRKTELSGGPKSKGGGMKVVIKQREEGSIVTALTVYCYEIGGELVTEVFNGEHELVATCETKR